ncbi:DHH family protein [Candidatus Saccharibacteria bacterium]|nr:DHH family protein [Candidatus Saccharibacteria bacterium]MBI3338347.1 DHH family protein [Candidatus Saccharibacteria bacterium]
MRVVTSGSAYVDIDAYAGAIAYAELLQVQGNEAAAVSTAPLNESISDTVRSWQAPLKTDFSSSDSDTYTLIDVSDPDYFDKVVDPDKVDEVIDHHPGFEQYWQKRIGDKADIEFIGAACTLVYERWKTAGLLGKMSVVSARLLVCGILDNTLNFGAKVTTERDTDAYDALLAQADLPDDWTAQYFTECQEAILSDAVAAIQNDTKTLTFKSFAEPICFGQLVVWDSNQVLAQHSDVLREALVAVKPEWFMNLISVGEKKSYFVTDNPNVQDWLTKLLGVHFDGSVAVADRLWLRKEVIKQDITNG